MKDARDTNTFVLLLTSGEPVKNFVRPQQKMHAESGLTENKYTTIGRTVAPTQPQHIDKQSNAKH